MIGILFLMCLAPPWCFKQTQIGSNITRDAAGDALLYSVSLGNTGNIMAIGASKSDGHDANSVPVQVFINQFLICSRISG